jgi:hypothetical protein
MTTKADKQVIQDEADAEVRNNEALAATALEEARIQADRAIKAVEIAKAAAAAEATAELARETFNRTFVGRVRNFFTGGGE